jgi:hypothetical protein
LALGWFQIGSSYGIALVSPIQIGLLMPRAAIWSRYQPMMRGMSAVRLYRWRLAMSK